MGQQITGMSLDALNYNIRVYIADIPCTYLHGMRSLGGRIEVKSVPKVFGHVPLFWQPL